METRQVICLQCGKRFEQRRVRTGAWSNRQCLGCGAGYLVEVLRDRNGRLAAGGVAGDERMPEAQLDHVDELLPPRGVAVEGREE